mmetsp:Transcript_6569/g.26673  ORF Transcript_6569/g.26673 Transcript_6569/m.26673 type:complete len:219 (+) Transcript_6569:676-1332(+)
MVGYRRNTIRNTFNRLFTHSSQPKIPSVTFFSPPHRHASESRFRDEPCSPRRAFHAPSRAPLAPLDADARQLAEQKKQLRLAPVLESGVARVAPPGARTKHLRERRARAKRHRDAHAPHAFVFVVAIRDGDERRAKRARDGGDDGYTFVALRVSAKRIKDSRKKTRRNKLRGFLRVRALGVRGHVPNPTRCWVEKRARERVPTRFFSSSSRPRFFSRH